MLREEIRAITSTRRDLRNFGLVVGGAFFLIGTLLLWRDRPGWPWFGGGGLLLALAGLAAPERLRPLQRVWMTLAVIMGWFMTRLILSVLFFAILTPIGLAARMAGRRFLDHLPRDEGAESYWHRREEGPSGKKELERQF